MKRLLAAMLCVMFLVFTGCAPPPKTGNGDKEIYNYITYSQEGEDVDTADTDYDTTFDTTFDTTDTDYDTTFDTTYDTTDTTYDTTIEVPVPFTGLLIENVTSEQVIWEAAGGAVSLPLISLKYTAQGKDVLLKTITSAPDGIAPGSLRQIRLLDGVVEVERLTQSLTFNPDALILDGESKTFHIVGDMRDSISSISGETLQISISEVEAVSVTGDPDDPEEPVEVTGLSAEGNIYTVDDTIETGEVNINLAPYWDGINWLWNTAWDNYEVLKYELQPFGEDVTLYSIQVLSSYYNVNYGLTNSDFPTTNLDLHVYVNDTELSEVTVQNPETGAMTFSSPDGITILDGEKAEISWIVRNADMHGTDVVLTFHISFWDENFRIFGNNSEYGILPTWIPVPE